MKTLVFVLVVCAAVLLSHGRWWQLPDRHNPWAPLEFEEPPGWLTRHKLRKLDEDAGVCLAFLATTPLQATPVPDRRTGEGCGFDNAVLVRRMAVQVNAPFTLSCRAAASLALWERHVLQPQAHALLGSGVRQLQHFGSYACRNVYGRDDGRRSRHATADALDVSGFVLDDGRRISVARDWNSSSSTAQFLTQAHAGACGVFDGVLGPAYNAAHADHFHFDRGSFRVCR
jgi:hypothetical protein